MTDHAVTSTFRQELARLFRWRRDVRHFKTDPIPVEQKLELLNLAALAPSVGLSEPWRFVDVESSERRTAVKEVFETANRAALTAQEGTRAALYATLKLAGLDQAPWQLAVFIDPEPIQGHGLGRRTMPQTVEYSAVMAIHTLWLAAHAAGLGLGWVSIVDPAAVARVLDVPSHWKLVAYLCLGYPAAPRDTPELEIRGWERRRPLEILSR
jgi:5,6-dimethylbenzimidazole synthase